MNTNKLPSRGGKQGKAGKRILDGFYFNESEVEGAHMLHAMNNLKVAILSYGMLIMHIIKRWACSAPSNPLYDSRIHVIGLIFIKNQKLVLFRERLIWGWEIDDASPEDRLEIDALIGRAPQFVDDDNDDDDDDEGEGPAHRASAAATGDMCGHVDTQGMFEGMRRLSERQDKIVRTQEAHGSKLRA